MNILGIYLILVTMSLWIYACIKRNLYNTRSIISIGGNTIIIRYALALIQSSYCLCMY